ncbi:hypothetical protein K523DRAFT_56101 [Schizophyllum commune Tattone D]|nr:hypothetical protein K523DRAFT_56101 [Schizophyllum commune Tattone D]
MVCSHQAGLVHYAPCDIDGRRQGRESGPRAIVRALKGIVRALETEEEGTVAEQRGTLEVIEGRDEGGKRTRAPSSQSESPSSQVIASPSQSEPPSRLKKRKPGEVSSSVACAELMGGRDYSLLAVMDARDHVVRSVTTMFNFGRGCERRCSPVLLGRTPGFTFDRTPRGR